MKTTTTLICFSIFWLVLGVAGLLTGNDAVFIVGLVNSCVNSCTVSLMRFFKSGVTISLNGNAISESISATKRD